MKEQKGLFDILSTFQIFIFFELISFIYNICKVTVIILHELESNP